MPAPVAVTFAHRLEALGVGAYLSIFARMTPERASDAGARLLGALGPLMPAHQTALKNLRLAFPNETERWRADVARAMWAGIGRSAGEFPHLGEIRPYAEDGRIEVAGVERLDAVKSSGRGAVFISGHFANWEIMAAAITQRGVVCHVTYRPANNPIIDKRIIAIRETYGAKLQSAKGKEGGMGLLRGLSRGETVALMNDQKYNEGVAAPLFGHNCMTADGPTRLAMRYAVPLIPFSIRRLGSARYRVAIHDPIAIPDDPDPNQAVRSTVRAVNAFMEARILEAPEEWFWVHRRWPKEAWGSSPM
jgi:KDO2-lipid IV(A) lauroyltransferase